MSELLEGSQRAIEGDTEGEKRSVAKASLLVKLTFEEVDDGIHNGLLILSVDGKDEDGTGVSLEGQKVEDVGAIGFKSPVREINGGGRSSSDLGDHRRRT